MLPLRIHSNWLFGLSILERGLQSSNRRREIKGLKASSKRGVARQLLMKLLALENDDQHGQDTDLLV